MQYFHNDIFLVQSSKRTGTPCGDLFEAFHDETTCYLVLADGLGSGLKANIYAQMCIARIKYMLLNGESLHNTFLSVSQTMNKAFDEPQPFAAFAIAAISTGGGAQILCYEMPPPLLVTPNYAQIIEDKVYLSYKAVVREAAVFLNEGEGIMLVSDGITQAGMGQGLVEGWEIKGVSDFLNRNLSNINSLDVQIAQRVHKQARNYWKTAKGDDCTVVLTKKRKGVTMNILTGPPANKADDQAFIEKFTHAEGLKVICGGSTAKLFARLTGTTIEIQENENPLVPPAYNIKGVTLATEGVVTLNRVYNLLDYDTEAVSTDESPVIQLKYFMKIADKIVFFFGNATNIEIGGLEFKQQGITARSGIINLLTQKLRQMGKVVVIKEFN